MKRVTGLAAILVLVGACASLARADEVTDWTQLLLRAGLATGSGPVMPRSAAIVESAIFDAVNGIERRYAPVHVDPAGPRGASTRAAAMQAAYATLVQLFPTQKGVFDGRRAATLAILGTREDPASIASGLQWGQAVADATLAWRSTDGFTPPPPPYLGGTNVGQWRPTPPGFAPGALPQFAYMTPFAIVSPSQFRPAGPPALTSSRYARDFNEVKMMGSATSAVRTADQTVYALFWASPSSINYLWDTVALSLMDREDDNDVEASWDHVSGHRHDRLLEHARILALLNITIADAIIACWEGKYTYGAWRPITAIALADTDGNPVTAPDPAWTPLLITPPHPEYPSGHSMVSSAAATILAGEFGEHTRFTAVSDLMPGVARSFRSFSAALTEIANARVFGGIHFRSACEDARTAGVALAQYVLEHALQPTHASH